MTSTIFDFFYLVIQTIQGLVLHRPRFRETIQQIYFVGVGSLPIVVICVSFAAVVTILESSFHMKLIIQNDFMVPGFASLLILRELGAVVTALLLTARVGAGIAAEVGSMKVTEQIDALRMMGLDPVNFLVVPRLIASVLGSIMLVVIANLVCLGFSMWVSQSYLGFTPSMFLAGLRRFADFQDLVFSLVKAAAFGAVIPLVSCYFGFRCEMGSSGVGKATTQSVVVGSMGIISIDFILSFVFSFFYNS